jgi:putative transposase
MEMLRQFNNDSIYHLYNRGVERRDIFLQTAYYLRFVVNLYEFNDRAPAVNVGYHLTASPIEVRLRCPRKEQLVDILAFCLMPNHYHLMIQQRAENGITMFMRKLGTGYTNYFNTKNNRVGPLFQGKFKSILLEREAHFIHLPHYIHLNPLDLKDSEWRNGTAENPEKLLTSLASYRWSSLPDYLNTPNFPTVTSRKFLTECIGRPKDFKSAMRDWIHKPNFDFVQKITLE